jgi:hypothetical protein
MTGKQNFIFFLGLTLIIIQYYLGGQIHAIHAAIFSGPPAGGTYGGQPASAAGTTIGNIGNITRSIPLPGLP